MKVGAMIRAWPFAILTISTAAQATPGNAVQTNPLVCPERWGEAGKSLVSKPETAKAIFLAVEADFKPDADKEGFPAVDVQDGGTFWIVYRWRPPVEGPDGHITLTEGGGQLSLHIAKCDGAISDVWLSR